MNGEMACCPRCEAPLIPTFAFSRYEFYCLDCGLKVDWLGPMGKAPSPELDMRYAALLAEWKAIAGEKLIGGGVRLERCAACTTSGEPHWNHATTAEKHAHEQALDALTARARPS